MSNPANGNDISSTRIPIDEIPDEVLQEAIDRQAARTDEVTVPLVIYVGDVRRIIGEARVTGPKVEAFVTPAEGPDVLIDMIRSGLLETVSVAFNAPPAIPVMDDNGHIRWKKDY